MSALSTENSPSPRRLIDTAYDMLKSDIIRCRLQPGEQVSEAFLAQHYGLGKAPIRSALSRLCHEKLIEPLPRRGHRVARLTVRDVIDVFEMRIFLEPKAARMAAGRIDKDTLEQLSAICRLKYQPGDSASRVAYLQATHELHQTIANASGNQRLAAAIGQLLDESMRMRHLGLASVDKNREMRAQHTALVEAIRDGDGEKAETICAEHLQDARKVSVDAIMNNPEILNSDVKIREQDK